MAGMFYSLEEVTGKLNKTEDEVRALVKEGKLREFRDGANLLFKVAEVDALAAEESLSVLDEVSEEAPETKPEDEGIFLDMEEQAETEEDESEKTAAAGEGIDVLGESDAGEYEISDDTMAETKITSGETSLVDDALDKTRGPSEGTGVEEIEGDVNLDSFGSGSGLLDLSLQADDTSLGGILDEIYTPEGEEAKEEGEGLAEEEVPVEAEEILPEAMEIAEPEPAVEYPAPEAAVYVEPESDKSSNIFGMMLFLPLAVVVYTTIVAMAGQRNISPIILTAVKGIIWYVLIGIGVVALVIAGVSSGGGKGAATTKKKKEKKPKKKKEKKPKKKKKGEKEPEAKQAVPEEGIEQAEESVPFEEAGPAEEGLEFDLGDSSEPDLDLDDDKL